MIGFNRKTFNIFTATIVIALLLVLTNFVKNSYTLPKLVINKEDSSYTINKNFLSYASFGNQRLFSSILWTYTLLSADIVHIEDQSKSSWLYERFNTISFLDKDFYENYLYGGQYLSIIKDDIYGAEKIYSKGLEIYPDDFNLLWNSGFNYYFELKEYKKALEVYEHLFKLGGADRFKILPIFISNLKSENHGNELAFNYLVNIYRTMPDGSIKDNVEADLYAYKALIDLYCLNKTNRQCQSLDFYGNPYIKKDNIYYPEKALKKKFHSRLLKVIK